MVSRRETFLRSPEAVAKLRRTGSDAMVSPSLHRTDQIAYRNIERKAEMDVTENS